MHADMTAVTTQSNQIGSDEVKDNLALLEPSWGKKQVNVLASPIPGCLPRIAEDSSGGTWCWQQARRLPSGTLTQPWSFSHPKVSHHPHA